ncbi:MAG: hypothetical protein AB7K09_17500 [Planctomycetota bacterium]
MAEPREDDPHDKQTMREAIDALPCGAARWVVACCAVEVCLAHNLTELEPADVDTIRNAIEIRRAWLRGDATDSDLEAAAAEIGRRGKKKGQPMRRPADLALASAVGVSWSSRRMKKTRRNVGDQAASCCACWAGGRPELFRLTWRRVRAVLAFVQGDITERAGAADEDTLFPTLAVELVRARQLVGPGSCPRRHCWFWHSLYFDWEISVDEGCDFLARASGSRVWNDPDVPCRRADPTSSIDHFEPRQPHIMEDEFDVSEWLQ